MSSTFNSTFTNPMMITIPLAKAMNSNLFSAFITFPKLHYVIPNRRIVLFLSVVSKAQTNIIANLTS